MCPARMNSSQPLGKKSSLKLGENLFFLQLQWVERFMFKLNYIDTILNNKHNTITAESSIVWFVVWGMLSPYVNVL